MGGHHIFAEKEGKKGDASWPKLSIFFLQKQGRTTPAEANGSNKNNSEDGMGEEAPGGTPFAGSNGEQEVGGKEAGGGGHVARIICNVAACPDDSRGRSIRGEPASHLWPTVGGKAPTRNF